MSDLTPAGMKALKEQLALTDRERELFKRWWEEGHATPRNISDLPKEDLAWRAWLHRSRVVEIATAPE